MNYKVFERMQEGTWAKGPAEDDQAYMERILTEAFRKNPKENGNHIYEMLKCKFSSCNCTEQILAMEFPVQEWELNPMQTMHGGLLVTAIDMTCGMLVRVMKQSVSAATVQLSVDFLRPLPVDEDFIICAKINKLGRRIIFLTAEVKIKSTDQIAATASGTFV